MYLDGFESPSWKCRCRKGTAINGLRATKDAVKFYDPELMRPEKAPYN